MNGRCVQRVTKARTELGLQALLGQSHAFFWGHGRLPMRKEYDFSKLKKAEPKYLKRLKEPVTIRLDPSVIFYFKSLAKETSIPYQSLINYVLKDYLNHGLEPSANWEKSKDHFCKAC